MMVTAPGRKDRQLDARSQVRWAFSLRHGDLDVSVRTWLWQRSSRPKQPAPALIPDHRHARSQRQFATPRLRALLHV